MTTLIHELSAIKAVAVRGISAGRSGSNDTTWSTWESICYNLAFNPFLANIPDPVPLLQIFAERYRVGTLSPSKAKVKARTVEGALRAVGQTMDTLRYQDP